MAYSKVCQLECSIHWMIDDFRNKDCHPALLNALSRGYTIHTDWDPQDRIEERRQLICRLGHNIWRLKTSNLLSCTLPSR